MGPVGKDKLVFDTAATLIDNDNVGAYLRGADGTLITHTNEAGKDALDVHVTNPSIAVTATDLDIRDLSSATDSVTAIQGTSPWVVGDGGGSLTVDALNLDIRDLVFATDKVDVSGSSVTVSATDLDIRDLSHLQDSIKIGDGVDFLAINADGSINVNADISVVNGHEKAEDAASASGDIGSYVLSVRQDTLASSTSTDGDYQSFKTDSLGSLWTRISKMPAPDAPNTAFTAATVSVDATVGGTALVASPLANRKKLLIQNLGNKPIYIGPSGVTAANGIRVAAGGNWEIEAGPAIAVYAITTAGSVDVRVFELA